MFSSAADVAARGLSPSDRLRRLQLAVLPDGLGGKEQAEREIGGVEHHPPRSPGLDLGEGGVGVEGTRDRSVEVADRDVEVRG